jgi:hypothetical protein
MVAVSLLSFPAQADDSLRELSMNYDRASGDLKKYRILVRIGDIFLRSGESDKDRIHDFRKRVLYHGMVHGSGLLKRGKESAAARWYADMAKETEAWGPSPRAVRADKSGTLESWPVVLYTACVYHAQTRGRGLAAVYRRQAKDYRRIRFKKLGDAVAAGGRECDRRLGRVDSWASGQYVTGRGLPQKWIGKIVRHSSGKVVVRLRYGASGSPHAGRTGKTEAFSKATVVPLKDVSHLAILSGWR